MVTEHRLEVKSKFESEFRRVSIILNEISIGNLITKFDDLQRHLERLHHLEAIPFVVQYVDPKSSSLLPINNDENYAVAVKSSKPLLRILLQKKGESYGELYGYTGRKSGRFHKDPASLLRSYGSTKAKLPEGAISGISIQNDFRLVSSILDVETIPSELRRVRLIRTADKHFGLYIRNGLSHRSTINGYESVPAFFVSRLDKDGIAYGTGLLAEDDEIVEVNGIEVSGKSMDQVSDMMVANSSNLIITVRPADQRTCLPPNRGSQYAKTKSISASIPRPDMGASRTSDGRRQQPTGSGSTLPLHKLAATEPRNRRPDEAMTGGGHVNMAHNPHSLDEEDDEDESETGFITL